MSDWNVVVAPEREVTVDGWGAMAFDEVMFRAAQSVSDGGVEPVDGEVRVTLEVAVTVDAALGALELRYDSAAEGRVVVRLRPPF